MPSFAGDNLNHYLNRDIFYAVPHAVESLKSGTNVRTVFARMKTPPLEAFSMNGSKRFEDVFYNNDLVSTRHRSKRHEIGK